MLNFKDQLNHDIGNVFFNEEEFGERHILNGQVINSVIDNDLLKERSKKEYDGIHIGEILLFVPKRQLKIKIKQDMPVVFDGKQMYIFSIREDVGVYEIILNQNSGN